MSLLLAFGRKLTARSHFVVCFPPTLTFPRPQTSGLVLFLFLVGLEVDISVIKRNARSSTMIAFAGMLLPFGLGAAVSFSFKPFSPANRI